MGIEYRIETYDFERAEVARKLRDRSFLVRETPSGIALWESDPAHGMPNIELQPAEGSVTLVVYGGSPAFAERVVGVVLMSLAAVNDHVVFSET